MNLVQVKFPAPNRVVNIGYKSYISDKDSMCNIPEEDASSLPLTYKVVGKIESLPEKIKEEAIVVETEVKKEEKMEEIKKVVKEEEDIKKVVVKEKATVTKGDK